MKASWKGAGKGWVLKSSWEPRALELEDFLTDTCETPFEICEDGRLLVADIDLLTLLAEYLQHCKADDQAAELEADDT